MSGLNVRRIVIFGDFQGLPPMPLSLDLARVEPCWVISCFSSWLLKWCSHKDTTQVVWVQTTMCYVGFECCRPYGCDALCILIWVCLVMKTTSLSFMATVDGRWVDPPWPGLAQAQLCSDWFTWARHGGCGLGHQLENNPFYVDWALWAILAQSARTPCLSFKIGAKIGQNGRNGIWTSSLGL
jgi:hypothetical protein